MPSIDPMHHALALHSYRLIIIAGIAGMAPLDLAHDSIDYALIAGVCAALQPSVYSFRALRVAPVGTVKRVRAV